MSRKKAFVAVPFFSPADRWMSSRFADALRVEAERKRVEWEFVFPKEGNDLEDVFREQLEGLNGVQVVVVPFWGEDVHGVGGVAVGYAHARGVPVVGVDMGGSERALSLFRALGAPLVVWRGKEDAWDEVARAVLDRMDGRGELAVEFPGLVRHGIDVRPPHGFQGVCRVFGFIEEYVRDDDTLSPSWEKEMLGYARLPFALPLSWAPEKKVTRIRCHRLLVPVFKALFQEIVERGLRPLVRTYGGCFCFRRMRGGSHLSTHSWGIAIDLNPNTNPLGSSGDMAPELVELFGEFGFTWGGTFSRPDPMHFQFCSGY